MYTTKRITKTAYLAAALVLSSCGGESSYENSDSLEDTTNIQVSKTEFDTIMDREGTWLATFDLLTSFRSEFESLSHSGEVSVDLTAFAIAPFYLRVQEGGSLTQSQCSVYGPIELPDASFENQFTEDFLVEQLNDKFNLPLDTNFCTGDVDIAERYFKTSPAEYSIEYYCGEEKVGGLNLERIANDTEFSKGSLSFASDTYPDLEADDASSGCGNLLEFDVIARVDGSGGEEPRSYSFDMAAVSITSGYETSNIGLDFLFSSTLTLGDHEVSSLADTLLADDISKVAVTVTSAELGGTASFPMHLVANSGIVTVTEITDKSASGRYNFTTSNGANFNGNFSFDYE